MSSKLGSAYWQITLPDGRVKAIFVSPAATFGYMAERYPEASSLMALDRAQFVALAGDGREVAEEVWIEPVGQNSASQGDDA